MDSKGAAKEGVRLEPSGNDLLPQTSRETSSSSQPESIVPSDSVVADPSGPEAPKEEKHSDNETPGNPQEKKRRRPAKMFFQDPSVQWYNPYGWYPRRRPYYYDDYDYYDYDYDYYDYPPQPYAVAPYMYRGGHYYRDGGSSCLGLSGTACAGIVCVCCLVCGLAAVGACAGTGNFESSSRSDSYYHDYSQSHDYQQHQYDLHED